LKPVAGLRALWPWAAPHRAWLYAALGCMAVLGAATGVYAWMLGPALRLLLSGGREGVGLAAELFPVLAQVDPASVRTWLPVSLVAVGAVKGLAYLGQFYSMGMFGQRVGADVRRRLFLALICQSPVQLAGRRVGDLLARFGADVTAVELAANYTVGGWARDGIQVVVLAGVAVALNWKLALLAALAVPLAAWPAVRLTRTLFRRTREGHERLGGLAARVQEGVGGVRTLQAFNAQGEELVRFDRDASAQLRAARAAGWARGGAPGVMEVLGAASVSAVLAWTATRSSLPPEELLSFLGALVLLYQPAKQLGRVGQFAVQAVAARARLTEILDVPPTVVSAPGAPVPSRLSRSVELRGVGFRYGDRAVLRGLDLVLAAGRTVALVGPSGAGKSTVTQLLLRFSRPDEGHLLLDGVDVETLDVDGVRAQFALVTQEPLLFAGTVRDNLRVGRPEATNEELEAAARAAHAHGFVLALPNGYDTRVGERGVNLSGGQRQRLCLARALVSGAPVLVLDEATSSLDPESEAEVQRALAGLLPGRTALIIAHRLSTVVDADLICVLDEGRVVESGTHAALLEQGGAYARLWALQHREAA
jgi:subfamily B ATP-binding cassette protein MsbA